MERADSKKERMGLTTWKNSPHGKIIKTDVSIVQDRLFESDFDKMIKKLDDNSDK